MSIVRYDPFLLLDQLQNDLNRMFDQHPLRDEQSGGANSGEWAPAVDIREEEGRYVILADLPGVEPKDVEVTLENGVLTLKGTRESVQEEKREGYHRIERRGGSFIRRFTLPEASDPEKVGARFNQGVLEIDIEKQAKAQPKRIDIKVE